MNQINSITAIHYETMRTVRIDMAGGVIRSITEMDKTEDNLPIVPLV